MAETLVGVKLDDEDLGMLEACMAREKLNRSDSIRRAIRHYAEHLGVKPDQRSKPKRKR
jgi:metal-responsive CopG/Arc/MetJ family transcriptional regulator